MKSSAILFLIYGLTAASSGFCFSSFAHLGGSQKHASECITRRSDLQRCAILTMQDNAGKKGITVTLKIALDSNGAVDDLALKAKRFTSSESLDAVHRLRRDSSAVLVGVGTVDDPGLTVRRVPLREGERQPLRVVLDPDLRTPKSSALLVDGYQTLVVCRGKALKGNQASQALGHVEVVECRESSERQLDLHHVLSLLLERGVHELMVEGGPHTARAFLSQQLVDRAVVIRAPMAFTGEPVPSGISDVTLSKAGLKKLAEHRLWGADLTSLWLKDGAEWPTPDDPSAWP